MLAVRKAMIKQRLGTFEASAQSSDPDRHRNHSNTGSKSSFKLPRALS